MVIFKFRNQYIYIEIVLRTNIQSLTKMGFILIISIHQTNLVLDQNKD